VPAFSEKRRTVLDVVSSFRVETSRSNRLCGRNFCATVELRFFFGRVLGMIRAMVTGRSQLRDSYSPKKYRYIRRFRRDDPAIARIVQAPIGTIA